MRLLITSRACRCPMMRRFRMSARFRIVCISFFTILPTGIPVQSETTEATVWASAVGRMRGLSPCNSFNLACNSLCSCSNCRIC